MSEPMIEITNLHKSFGALPVLRGVNLTVEKGESMTVIGGSGSGKSVLIKHIIGLLFPDKGEVKVAGQVLNNLDDHQLNEIRKKFGMLFQMAALFDSLTVWENVGFGLKQHTKLSDKEVRAIATEKLALVGLKNAEARGPRPRNRHGRRDHPVRRADHGARPDHGGLDQRPDRRSPEEAGRDLGGHHPRHAQRL